MSLNNKVNVSLTPSTAIVNYKGKTEMFQAATAEYAKLKELLKKDNSDGVRDKELVEFVESYRSNKNNKDGQLKSVDYRVSAEGTYINGDDGEMLLPAVLGKRLLEFVSEGLPTEPIVKFAKRLSLNPSYTSVQRLFDHLENHHHCLLPDGRLLAWKRVRKLDDGKLVDFYTGKFNNSVGQKPFMKRNEVNEDNKITCSYGLHIASYNYAVNYYQGGNGVLIEVAVDPSDVVAIPFDYQGEKMRVTSYEVLNVCEEEDKSKLKNHVDGFAIDPNSEDVCDGCGEDIDYCDCDEEDNESFDDDDETCDDCGEDFEDCTCFDDEDEDDLEDF